MNKELKTADKTAYNKTYYEQNKDKLKEQALRKIKCPHCDKEYSQANWNKHIKSDKHKTKEQLHNQTSGKMKMIDEELKQLRDKLNSLSS